MYLYKSYYYLVIEVVCLWLEGGIVSTFQSWPTKSLLFQSLDFSYSRHCQDYMVGVMWTNVHLELEWNRWASLYSRANPRFDWCFWLQSITKSNLLDFHFPAHICSWLNAAFYMVFLLCFFLRYLCKTNSILSAEKIMIRKRADKYCQQFWRCGFGVNWFALCCFLCFFVVIVLFFCFFFMLLVVCCPINK